jgi:hypothetical protein
VSAAEPALSEGTQTLNAEDPEPSFELALDLARKGGSDQLVAATGGAGALPQIREIIVAERRLSGGRRR